MEKNMLDSNRPILLVEDDEVDVMTVKRAAKIIKIKNPIHHAGDGEAALEYLEENEGKIPCIIILDINMPRMNGIEFLKIIKEDDRFKRIPVIVLTTSKEQQDRYETFNLSVAGYMLKPVDYDQFVEIMDTIKKYWSLSEFAD